MMKPVIKNYKKFPNPVLGSEDGVSTVISLYHEHEPGQTSEQHEHDWEHQAFIVGGAGVVFVEGFEYPIQAGDFVLIPPNSFHYFKNTGSVTLSRVTFNPIRSEKHIRPDSKLI